jgi:hypothetical protein
VECINARRVDGKRTHTLDERKVIKRESAPVDKDTLIVSLEGKYSSRLYSSENDGSLLFIFRSLSFRWLHVPDCMCTPCYPDSRGTHAGAERCRLLLRLFTACQRLDWGGPLRLAFSFV